MYLDRRRKGQHWGLSGRYGAAGKRWERKTEKATARDLGQSIQRMAGGGQGVSGR